MKMAGSDPRWLCCWIVCVLISYQFRGISASTLLYQQDFQDNRDSGDGRGSKAKEDDVHEVHCSRERSRIAWRITQEYLMPFVEKEGYKLPTRCRLHRDNDIYREQEEHKAHIDINEWQCGFCKKTFYEEKYLDKHFDNRHHHLLNRMLGGPMWRLHCDLVMDSMKRKSKCNPAAAARNWHMCERLADNCFPVKMGPSASRLHEFFLRQFCDAHTCSGSLKPLSKKLKKTSVVYVCVSIIILMLLPLFCSFVYLYQRGLKTGSRELRRISRGNLKKKPF